jgi:hypothetical protein
MRSEPTSHDGSSDDAESSDESDVFEALYDEYGEELAALADSENPAAPLAQLVIDEAGGETDA